MPRRKRVSIWDPANWVAWEYVLYGYLERDTRVIRTVLHKLDPERAGMTVCGALALPSVGLTDRGHVTGQDALHKAVGVCSPRRNYGGLSGEIGCFATEDEYLAASALVAAAGVEDEHKQDQIRRSKQQYDYQPDPTLPATY